MDTTLATIEYLDAARSPALACADGDVMADVISAITCMGDPRAWAHARHVAAWAARLGSYFPEAGDPVVLRRCGMLLEVEPRVLETVSMLRPCAPVVAEFQAFALGAMTHRRPSPATGILAVADEFDRLVFPQSPFAEALTPRDALLALHDVMGAQFPAVVTVLGRMLGEMRARTSRRTGGVGDVIR
jgi:hypothetical protein